MFSKVVEMYHVHLYGTQNHSLNSELETIANLKRTVAKIK